jgi:hypothetical protein
MNRAHSRIVRTVGPALVALAALAFTGTAWAHNIIRADARAECLDYVQGVLDDPDEPYTNANVKTERAFSGHNHYVRCTVRYDTARTRPSKNYACTETLDVYLLPEGADREGTYFMRHTSAPCGSKRLTGPRPG